MSMMSRFDVFSNKELGSVRTCFNKETQEIYFCGKDICNILEIATPQNAYSRLDEDEKIVFDIQDLRVCLTDAQNESRRRRLMFVTESGMYSMVLASRKPAAKDFKRWLTHEVIPSIRKTGGYILGQENMEGKERARLELELAALAKKAEENAEAWKADAMHQQDMYERLLADYAKAVRQDIPEENGTPTAPATYVTDTQGFIMKKEEFLSLDRE